MAILELYFFFILKLKNILWRKIDLSFKRNVGSEGPSLWLWWVWPSSLLEQQDSSLGFTSTLGTCIVRPLRGTESACGWSLSVSWFCVAEMSPKVTHRDPGGSMRCALWSRTELHEKEGRGRGLYVPQPAQWWAKHRGWRAFLRKNRVKCYSQPVWFCLWFIGKDCDREVS